MHKNPILFFLIACVAVLFLPMFALADTDHLVISQVQITGGPGKTTNDFVEIYNPTPSDIDLKGFRLVKRTKTGVTDTSIKSWTSSTIIKAHGFYLWANSDFTAISPSADVTTTTTVSEDNAVAIRNGPLDTGTIVDSLGWGAAINAFVEGLAFLDFTNNDANKSLERSPGGDLGNGTDLGDNLIDFIKVAAHPRNSQSPAMPPIVSVPTPPEPTPTPAPAEEPTGPKYSHDIIISEFLPNPDGPDGGKEWVEFYNNSPDEVDLADWILDSAAATNLIGKNAYVFSAKTIIKPNSFFTLDLPEGSFLLNNTGGDTLRLFWPNKTLLTQATYSGNARDDETYARKIDATYAWTNLATKGTVNQFPGVVEGIVSAAETRIKLTEIYPGGWMEIINTGTEPILIHNWTVDGGKPGSAIDASAWKIQSPTLNAGGLAVLTIPAGTFTLDNLSGHVRLFNENGILIDSVSFSDVKAGMSYALIDNSWTWITPTPNATNVLIIQTPTEPVNVKENPIILAVDEKPVNTHAALSQLAPVDEPQLQIPPAGVVSAAAITQPDEQLTSNSQPSANNWFILWIVASFALNLAFCYILVKLMLRNKGI